MGLILPQLVKTKISPKELNYYKSKGYSIPKKIGKNRKIVYDRNAEIEVHVLDLPNKSYKKVFVICDLCNSIYQLTYKRALQCSHNGKHFCKHCHCKQFISGENNPNWNPNRTRFEREQARQTQEYRDFVKTVLSRDKHTCQCCGVKGDGKNLNAHHLNAWNLFPEQRYDTTNGITLCKECHNAYHSTYGHGNNTKLEFDNWINKSIDNILYNYETPSLRKVFCLEENKVYNGVPEFHKIHNSTKSNIYQCCNNFLSLNRNNWTINGLHVFWLDEYENASKDDFYNYFNSEKHQNSYLTLLNINNGERYYSVKDMKNKLNITDYQWRCKKCEYPYIMYYNDFLLLPKEQQNKLLLNNYESFNKDSFLMQQFNIRKLI